MMSLYQWLSILGGPALVSLVIWVFLDKPVKKRITESEQRQEELKIQNEAIKRGIQALLRDRLLQGYQFYEERGYANYEEKSNMENLHTQYAALGQNGIMDNRHAHFIELPDHE